MHTGLLPGVLVACLDAYAKLNLPLRNAGSALIGYHDSVSVVNRNGKADGTWVFRSVGCTVAPFAVYSSGFWA